MPNPLYALVPAVIWAFSPIYYRGFMKRFDFLLLNFLSTAMASAVLLLPAVYSGFTGGVLYALASGLVTLACGDSLFLLSIREMGASIAAPVVYTYVLFVQLTATAVGRRSRSPTSLLQSWSWPVSTFFLGAGVVSRVRGGSRLRSRWGWHGRRDRT